MLASEKELIGSKEIVRPYCDLIMDEGKELFDLLWNGYYVNS